MVRNGRVINYEVREYKCYYCSFGPFEEATARVGSKRQGGTNPVICPRCKNKLRVKEGKFLRDVQAQMRI